MRILTKDGKLFIPFEKHNLYLLRSIPGSKFNFNEACWHVSLRPEDRERLLEICFRLDVQVPQELRTIKYATQAQHADRKGLYDYQVDGVNWLSAGRHRLLADDMGLGKTIQAIVALPKKSRTMVVVPACVKHNWKQECERWRTDFNVNIINKSSNFRVPDTNEFLIINYDILPAYLTEQNKKDLNDIILIIDEAHKIKNSEAKRSMIVKDMCNHAGKIWALTGTPLENNPEDLFGILDTLNMRTKVFGNWEYFVKCMNGTQDSWGNYSWGKPDPIVYELLRRVMLRRRRKDVLPDLPDKKITYLNTEYNKEITTTLDELYKKYKKCTELPSFEEFSSVRKKIATSRINNLIKIIESHEEEQIPLVVFSCHLEPLQAIGRRLGWKCITGATSAKDRQKIVNEFQSGILKGVAVSIRAGGVGINLTRAWKAVFVDRDWTPGANAQAEDRICRIGQKSQKVEIVIMTSDHPLDQHLNKLTDRKIKIIEEVIG